MQLLTVREAAQRLAVSKSTLYALIEQGKIAIYRVGTRRGGIRIAEADLDQYLASCRQEKKEEQKPKRNSRIRLRHLKL